MRDDPSVRAPTRSRLAVCIDRTWNTLGADQRRDTNVLRVRELLVTGPTQRVIYYSVGVGTHHTADAVPTRNVVSGALIEVAFGVEYARLVVSVVVSLVFALRSAARSRAALHLEIFALRHQLAVLNRSRRPRLRVVSHDSAERCVSSHVGR